MCVRDAKWLRKKFELFFGGKYLQRCTRSCEKFNNAGALNCKPKRSLNWCYFTRHTHIWCSTIKWNYISHFRHWKLWSSSNKGFSTHFKWPQRITEMIWGQGRTEATAATTMHSHRCNFFVFFWQIGGRLVLSLVSMSFVIWSQAKHQICELRKKCSIKKQLNQQQQQHYFTLALPEKLIKHSQWRIIISSSKCTVVTLL